MRSLLNKLQHNNLKIGVVGIPGGWSSEKLADAVADKTGSRILIDMTKIETCLSSGKVRFDGLDLASLDAIIVKKINSVYSPVDLERLELLRYLQAQGVRVFSKPENILRLISRLACTVTLRNAGIPMPETVITEDMFLARDAILRLGRAVLKPLFSTKARGMVIVDSADADIIEKISVFKQTNSVMYLQQVVDIPGRDLGVVFLGGRYLATYARQGSGDSWNTTINSGGHYVAHEPSVEILRLAEKAQAPFGLDFTCVDVVETAQGPMVFEVSAFGGYRGLQDSHGIDAARLYTDYAVDSLQARQSGAA
jgi:tetrahydromethanopterin:alpha-L-glutamate ligase